jgi:YfiH family protein
LIEPVPARCAGHGLARHESAGLVFGFTDAGFPSPLLKEMFPGQELLFLKQVHSGRIVSDREWHAGVEADGLLLEGPGAVAVVQTADCLPLFFFNKERSRGGIVHIGWRGLQQGIEEKLAQRLWGKLNDYFFYLGPAIEKKCYEVGAELPGLFAKKAYAKELFSEIGGGKHLMDLKRGVKLSLAALGVSAGRIQDSGLCTFCSAGRFPSYRRDGKTGRRIFNFLLLKK